MCGHGGLVLRLQYGNSKGQEKACIAANGQAKGEVKDSALGCTPRVMVRGAVDFPVNEM